MTLVIRQTASYAGSDAGGERWNWSVWIDGPDAELDQVESVEWVLHPTFPTRSCW
jgi:transcription initiation factor IIF auxiliary subunit